MLWGLTLLESVFSPRLSDDRVNRTQRSVEAKLKIQEMETCDAGIEPSGPLGGMEAVFLPQVCMP